jgi:2,4-dienoyl-CoA reductase-like NADH-dependent reductase (Old Yellow Enzyme family)
MAPMTRTFCPGGVPHDKVIEYYRRRAAAGVGLIITEGTTVGHKAANGYPNVPRFHGEDALAGWKRVVDAVHAEGGRSCRNCGMWAACAGWAPSRMPACRAMARAARTRTAGRGPRHDHDDIREVMPPSPRLPVMPRPSAWTASRSTAPTVT